MATAVLNGQAGNVIRMWRPEWGPSADQSLSGERIAPFNPVRTVHKPDRRITVNLGIVADNVAPDGRLHRDRQHTAAALLTAQGDPVTLLDFVLPVDGAVRVVLTFCAALLDHSGNAEIEGVMRICQGLVDADRPDEWDERRFQLYCPAGRTVNQFIRVPDESDGEDHAVLQLTIANGAA